MKENGLSWQQHQLLYTSEKHCPIEKEALSEPGQDADWKAAEEQGQEGHGRPAKETDHAPFQEAE